ncbi:MAG: hypothetical protein PHC28_05150 [Flavobacterium sp.]|uniref:hypothetical protein n=1 Tax=Flavobacterium sp. TaxID=239 RepID=UPI002603C743|nr:hypothetical protein [Flavobacterium sp.]MDD5149853.1 hypothetical protein [Flavobacterium sp.]
MARYKVYSISFNFEKPLLLTEEAYLNMKKGLPIYPQPDDVAAMVFNKYWTYLFYLIPPLFMVVLGELFTTGNIEPMQYRSALIKKNKFFTEYYNSIYYSKNYQEYCKINKDLKRQ